MIDTLTVSPDPGLDIMAALRQVLLIAIPFIAAGLGKLLMRVPWIPHDRVPWVLGLLGGLLGQLWPELLGSLAMAGLAGVGGNTVHAAGKAIDKVRVAHKTNRPFVAGGSS
jgi:hypothetical protein